MQALVRTGSEVTLKRFAARNVRAIMPPTWDVKLGVNVFSKLDVHEGLSRIPDGGREPVPWVTNMTKVWLNIRMEHLLSLFGK